MLGRGKGCSSRGQSGGMMFGGGWWSGGGLLVDNSAVISFYHCLVYGIRNCRRRGERLVVTVTSLAGIVLHGGCWPPGPGYRLYCARHEAASSDGRCRATCRGQQAGCDSKCGCFALAFDASALRLSNAFFSLFLRFFRLSFLHFPFRFLPSWAVFSLCTSLVFWLSSRKKSSRLVVGNFSSATVSLFLEIFLWRQH